MISIKSPSECVSAFMRRITKEQRLAFVSTFVIGFFCHLFIFTNSMYNNDDIRYLYVTFDKPELGRFLQTYAAGISSYFSLPVVNGILTLIYSGITSMILVALFRLQNKLGIVLVSGLLITFPTVACIYSFMFAADPFALSCTLSALAAYFVTRTDKKWLWIAGAACLCCSVGIYQAYLPFTLLLMLLFFILMLLQPEIYPDRTIITVGIRYLLMLFFGMGAYYIGMTLTLKLKHTALSDYQGIGESDFPGIAEIKARLLKVISDFLEFFSPSQVLAFNVWMRIALVLSLLLLALFFFVLYIRLQAYKSLLRNGLLLFCLICIPPAVNVIYLISDGVNFHMLMRHAWCLLFIAVIVLFEKTAPLLPKNGRACTEWIAFASLFLIVWNYILLSNIGYFNMNFRYEKTYALCLELRDRLKASEDFDKDRPIAFIGNYSKTYQMDATAELLAPMAGMNGKRVFGATSRAYLPFFQNCLGEDITVVTPEEEKALKETPEFQEMPRYPKEGSIQVINDVTVIKLNDD